MVPNKSKKDASRAFSSALCLLLIAVVLLSYGSPAAAEGENVVTFVVGSTTCVVNGYDVVMDVAPYLKNNRCFVPVRFAAVALGVANDNIFWDAATQTVTLIKDTRVVQLIAGSNILVVNGTAVTMDVAPEIVLGRVMLPVGWMALAFGASTAWDEVTQTATITCAHTPKDTPPAVAIPAGPSVAPDGEEEDDTIQKEYRWRDREGAMWEWKVPIPAALYEYYRRQPRIHERLMAEYREKIEALNRQLEEVRRFMDYWYEQCRISRTDSYDEAVRKYLVYQSAYNAAQRELSRIMDEYRKIELLYREARYRQIRDGYVPYATDAGNQKLIEVLADVLADKGPADLREKVEFVAAFVQEAIPYLEENGEYPRYPVETLVEGGDCEDKAILLAALLRSLGYRTALLVFKGDPGHMAVGVDCPDCWGSYYLKDGVKYFYLETTGPGWYVGEVPEEYRGERALVYVVP